MNIIKNRSIIDTCRNIISYSEHIIGQNNEQCMLAAFH